MFVNIAPQRDQARDVEDLGRHRSFIGPIAAEIETFRGRVGKDVVISIFLEIRELDPGADLDRQK